MARLAALSVAFAYFLKTRSAPKLYVVLVLACLARETGALLVAGCCISELIFRRFGRAALWGTACLPSVAWYWFLDTQVHEAAGIAAPRWFLKSFGLGLIGRLFDPPRYSLSPPFEMIARSSRRHRSKRNPLRPDRGSGVAKNAPAWCNADCGGPLRCTGAHVD